VIRVAKDWRVGLVQGYVYFGHTCRGRESLTSYYSGDATSPAAQVNPHVLPTCGNCGQEMPVEALNRACFHASRQGIPLHPWGKVQKKLLMLHRNLRYAGVRNWLP